MTVPTLAGAASAGSDPSEGPMEAGTEVLRRDWHVLGPYGRLIGRRLVLAVPVLLGVSFLSFLVMNALPGDAAQQLLGMSATPAQVHELEVKLHLNLPFWTRYGDWLNAVVHGHLGTSLQSTQPVSQILAQRLPVSLELVICAFIVSLVIAVPVALIAARRRDGLFDRVTMLVSMLSLAVAPYVLALVLVVPTGLYVHLRLPRLRAAMDVVTTLPIIVPPIVLIIGLLSAAPSWLKATPYMLGLEYVVLAFPFVYRSLDAGLRAIDHATLVDAARSLGAGWFPTFFRVLLPNLRAAILSGTVLCVALAFGEYTMATLDQYQTFPVWIVNFDQSNSPQVSVAASLGALAVTWAFLFAISYLGGGLRRRNDAGAIDDGGSQ